MLPHWLIVLGAAGATFVLTHGRIASWLRPLYPPLLCCPMCAGYWLGMLGGVAASATGPLGSETAWAQLFAWLLYGFATSIVASAVSVVLVTVGSNAKSHGYAPDDACAKMVERLVRERHDNERH